MKLRNTLLSAAAVIALGTAGSAATVVNGGALNAGDTGLATGLTNPGDLISFTYTANEDLRVLDFLSVTSNGFSGGTDLSLVEFGYTSAAAGNVTTSYSSISDNGGSSSAGAELAGFNLSAGDSFTFFFEYDGAGALVTSHQLTFSTAAPVPLPAGGLLLIGGLGAFAVARKRKAAKEA